MAKKNRNRSNETASAAEPKKPLESSSKAKRLLPLLGALIAVTVALLLVFRRDRADDVVAVGEKAENVIIVTIDTLRADALGFAGNTKVKTPFLDSLAADGIVFTNAHAHNVVTLASHTNIFTGLLPYEHGVRENAGFKLDPKYDTLAEMLKQQGFATGAFVGAFAVDARYGLNQGFDVYDDKYPEGSGKLDFIIQERPAAEVLKPAVEWWNAQQGKRFMWVHVYDPHAPYQPADAFSKEYFANPYLGEVASVDAALQQYLGPLLERDPNTLVIVTGDHGESLGEHGEATHGLFAYEATLKVPLIVRQPGVAPKRDERFVRHIDILPTVLSQLGLTVPATLKGKSLFDAADGRDTYFEALSGSLNRGWAPLVGMIHGGRKYIELPLPELYVLPTDPNEKNNLYTTERRSVFAIRKMLASAAPVTEASAGRTISSEEGAKLLSLGYITGAAAAKTYTENDDPKRLVHLDTKLHKIIEYYQLGQMERAVATAKEVVDERPDMEIAREMYSLVLQQSERVDSAIATLQESVRQGSATDSTKRRLGMILSETGRAREAVEVLAPLASKEDPELLNAYGIALADSGNIPAAVEQFKRVLQVDQTNATAYQNLGIVALRARQIELSQKYLEKALELNRSMPLALNTMGVLYAQTGKPDLAIDMWKRAIAADSKQYDAMFNVALVAGRVGRRAEAKEALERFIAAAPPQRYGSDIEKARALLKQLG